MEFPHCANDIPFYHYGKSVRYVSYVIAYKLQLLTELQEGLATCASWDLESHRWSTFGCQLVGSNGTHSKCSCRQLSTFALLAPSGKAHFNMRGIGSTIGGSGAHNDILIGVLAAFLLVLLLLLVVVMACFCRRRKVLYAFLYAIFENATFALLK